MKEHPGSAGNQVWAAPTKVGVDLWLGWLAVVLNLDRNNLSLCSLPKTGEKLLLTGRGAEAQTRQNDSAVGAGESPEYFFFYW